jgi:hypothetical protein
VEVFGCFEKLIPFSSDVQSIGWVFGVEEATRGPGEQRGRGEGACYEFMLEGA